MTDQRNANDAVINEALEVIDGLPVLAGQDLAGRKVLAILDRAEGRDFTDLRALTDRYSQAECIQWAQELDDGVRLVAIADAFTKLGRLRDTDLPCSPEAIPTLRAWFEQWSSDLRSWEQ